MDDEVIGFGVQVRQTARKSFTFDYMFEGRRRRLYIGDFPGRRRGPRTGRCDLRRRCPEGRLNAEIAAVPFVACWHLTDVHADRYLGRYRGECVAKLWLRVCWSRDSVDQDVIRGSGT
jgi:hypothetical protein